MNGRGQTGPGFCHLCGRPLNARARRFHHAAWPPELLLTVCEVCLAEKPRCPVCRLPGNAAGACPTCREVGPICAGCGRALGRQATTFGQSGPYCQECAAGPRCQSCGLPAGRRATAIDGRLLCTVCGATTVVSDDEAAAVYRAAESILREQLGLTLNVPTGLALVTPDELADILGDMGEDSHSGVETPGVETLGVETLGVYTRRGRRRGIYAVRGLPRRLLLQVAAHELAHAWQMENAPLLGDPLLREGFAEWVAYRVLLAVGEDEAAERILARQDNYGQGARLLLDMEKQVGARGVLDWSRRAR
ncbi:MAG TPA: hypothetical protein PK829_02325 [Promineifilum sp.]|nr:hypothetical protein [Promineifilum sp.]